MAIIYLFVCSVTVVGGDQVYLHKRCGWRPCQCVRDMLYFGWILEMMCAEEMHLVVSGSDCMTSRLARIIFWRAAWVRKVDLHAKGFDWILHQQRRKNGNGAAVKPTSIAGDQSDWTTYHGIRRIDVFFFSGNGIIIKHYRHICRVLIR